MAENGTSGGERKNRGDGWMGRGVDVVVMEVVVVVSVKGGKKETEMLAGVGWPPSKTLLGFTLGRFQHR